MPNESGGLMTPELKRLLEVIASTRRDADEASDAFREFSARYGVDNFLIGCGAFRPDGEFLGVQFMTSLDAAYLDEYDADNFADGDLVVERAAGLLPGRNEDALIYGRHIANDNGYSQASQRVFSRVADYGIGTGVAYISREFEGEVHHGFGLNFGTRKDNDHEGLARIREHRHELLIAAAGMTPKIQPALMRKLEGLQAVVLTDRETDVLALSSRGMQAQQIAHTLGIRQTTVGFHVRNIKTKLKAQTLSEAGATAYRLGFL